MNKYVINFYVKSNLVPFDYAKQFYIQSYGCTKQENWSN